jgi:hypothetical protein
MSEWAHKRRKRKGPGDVTLEKLRRARSQCFLKVVVFSSFTICYFGTSHSLHLTCISCFLDHQLVQSLHLISFNIFL